MLDHRHRLQHKSSCYVTLKTGCLRQSCTEKGTGYHLVGSPSLLLFSLYHHIILLVLGLCEVSIHELRILDMPSPCKAETKLLKVTLSKEPKISRKIPKAGFFLTSQCFTRRTKSCKAVSVETPARNPHCDAVSFAWTLLSSLI